MVEGSQAHAILHLFLVVISANSLPGIGASELYKGKGGERMPQICQIWQWCTHTCQQYPLSHTQSGLPVPHPHPHQAVCSTGSPTSFYNLNKLRPLM